MALANDVVSEVLDLCRDLISQLRGQLEYYRASVYKDEMLAQIDKRISELGFLLELLPFEESQEVWADYVAVCRHAAQFSSPGFCSYTQRVTQFLDQVEKAITAIYQHGMETEWDEQALKKNKNRLASLCLYGSQKWQFFYNL